MFSLLYIITFECACAGFLLLLFFISRKDTSKYIETDLADSFVRGTVRGILGMFVSNEMLEDDRNLVNSKNSKF